MKKKILSLFFLLSSTLLIGQNMSGFWFPEIGKFTGQTEFSIGFHFWEDHFFIRNIQLRTYSYLIPGLRFNSVLRSNKKENQVKFYRDSKPIYYKIAPNIDELYLEFFGFFYSKSGKLSASLRVGKMRYLRFPYYDNISKFDHVPGLSDLRSEEMSGYYGELLCLDYLMKFGSGYHMTLIHWDFYDKTGFDFIENFVFYKKRYKFIDFEFRAGKLQIREEPVGNSEYGYSSYLGINFKGFQIGIYFDKIENEKYTGISISFAPSRVTELLGRVRLDYTRACEGFVMQIPVFKIEFGKLKRDIPENSELVGTISAERVITFWRLGMMRNFYEHINQKNGDTDSDDLIIRINEKPMRLAIESIVSSFSEFNDFKDLQKWDSEGYRLGQYSQNLIYEFYRVKDK